MKCCLSPLALTCALLLAPTALAAVDGEKSQVDTSPTARLDLSRYLGTWHETARLDNLFERGLHAVTAVYERLANGRIRVTNAGTTEEGERREVSGMAQQVEGSTSDGALEVSFVPPYMGFYSDYRVLYVTPDYSGALVSNEDGSMLWILERSDESDPAVHEELLQEARRRGFDTEALIYDDAPDASGEVSSESEVDPE